MKLLRIIQIVRQDKKNGINGRHDRTTEINHLLGLDKNYTTDVNNTGKNRYVVDYKRSQFWYDNRPITFKAILDKLAWWHVQIWTLVGETGKSRVGFGSGMVKNRFGKKEVYNWLYSQSKVYDKILEH